MNKALTEQIIKHVLSNLGIIGAAHVSDKVQSIIDKQFVLPEKLTFSADGDVLQKNVYACQVSITDTKEFKMLLVDGGFPELPEYFLVVQLKDAPAFGLHFVNVDVEEDTEALIAASPTPKNWIPCNTYLQATFLAGMEQLRDVGFAWTKCSSYKEHFQQLRSFIDFCSNFYGDLDAGQED